MTVTLTPDLAKAFAAAKGDNPFAARRAHPGEAKAFEGMRLLDDATEKD